MRLLPTLALLLPLAASAADLTVTVDNVTSASGNLRIALYQGPENFLNQPAQRLSVPAAQGRVSFQFSDLPPGRYAATVFHDLNDNKKMETDQYGRPLEPVGFSRDAKANGGPPSFDDAAFALEGKTTQIAIRLRPGVQP